MCGSEKGPFFQADVEGTRMVLCSKCVRYASNAKKIFDDSVVDKKKKPVKKSSSTPQPLINDSFEEDDVIQLIRPDFGVVVKRARERLGLKQSDLARKLAVKESFLHSIETGHHEPDFELARKLEKHLRVSLIQDFKDEGVSSSNRASSGPLTIADIIKKK